MADRGTRTQRGRQKRPRVPDSLRKRASKACVPCRKHKEKCWGGRPCTSCQRHQRSCHFNNNERELMNVSNAPTRDTIPREQDSKELHMKRIISHFMGDISFEESDLHQLADMLERDHERIDEDRAGSSNALFAEDYSLDHLSTSTAHYSGELSHWNFSKMLERRLKSLGNNQDGQTSTHMTKGFFRPTGLQSSGSCITVAKTYFPPKHIALFLTRAFLKYAQTNYFYFEETTFFEKLEFYYSDDSALSITDAGWVCTLLMTFAIGAQFAHMETKAPTVDSTAVDNSPDYHIGVQLYRFSCRLIPDLITVASLETVQAFLLLGVYTLPIDTSGLAYTFYGLAIKMAVQNGMHRRLLDTSISRDIIEVRNRLWWSAYSLESRISVLHGRPVSISCRDVDTPMPTDLSSLRPAQGSSNLSNFVSTVTLTNYLLKASEVMKSLRRCHSTKKAIFLRQLAVTRNQLRSWWNSLPTEIHCRDLDPAGPFFRSNIHLEIYHATTLIYMGRPFIFQRLSESSDHDSLDDNSTFRDEPSDIANTLREDSLNASFRIIELCQQLQDSSGLARSSYTEFNGCRVALLALIAHSMKNSTDRTTHFLTQGLSLIRQMCVSLESARSEVAVIEALERARQRLYSHLDLGKQTDTGDVTGYDEFTEWAKLWQNDPIDANGLPLSLGFEIPIEHSSHGSSGSGPSFDGFLSSFPSELEEFTVIPGLDFELPMPDEWQEISDPSENVWTRNNIV